jgi:hypothetical protein
MNEVVDSPFQSRSGSTQVAEGAGSRALQSRENAEVLAMVAMAKRFPRDQAAAADRIRNAFTRTTLAEKAQYQFARGGSDIIGPSIHSAQAMAQQWGNLSNGWREVSRSVGPDGVGVSEVEAFCVDYESTNRESITFVVRHWRDTKRGGYALKDERDVYELCANQAQRRKRACILAQIPSDVTEMAMEQASVTLKTSADTSPEAMHKMVAAFGEFGVTKEQIEKRIQRRLDSIQPAQVVALKRIYVSLRDEMSTPADWFEIEAEQAAAPSGLDAVKAAAKAAGSGKAAPAARTARKGIDPQTGEVAPPAAAAPAAAKTGSDEPAVPAKSYAAYADSVLQATDAETAALELDVARGALPAEQYDELCAVFRNRWNDQ